MRKVLVLVTAAVIGASCGATPATPAPPSASPSGSPGATPIATPVATSPPEPAPTVTPTAPPAATFPFGSVIVTVADRVRVRSEPRVSDDSIRYEPVLPLGTELLVVGGPIVASGYVWWEVQPLSLTLEAASGGWVAMGDHDGEPWVAQADGSIAGLDVAMSAVARRPAEPAAAQAAARSINAFGLDLYALLRGAGTADVSNLVLSPTSIALALGMARAGARGETAAEMDEVLYAGGWDRLAAGLSALDQALAARDVSWADTEGTRQVALRIANASFAQRGWTIEQPFLDALAGVFGSGLHLVDYEADPEAARRAINTWVSRRTAGRIPDLLKPDNVSPDTRLYLVNAIYLRAEWERWFEVDQTESAPFVRLDGSRVSVPMMHRVAGAPGSVVPFARGQGWQAAELRYRAPEGSPPLAMTFVLPADFASFEAALDPELLAQIVAHLDAEHERFRDPDCPPDSSGEIDWCYPYDLELHLPRFSTDTRAELRNQLAAAGMPRAFQRNADFTGIHVPASPDEQLYIKQVIHQANIDVDERGTEAAAATAVGFDIGGGPAPLDKLTIRFDRPFLFFLRDVETGAVLFMGRIVDPSVTD